MRVGDDINWDSEPLARPARNSSFHQAFHLCSTDDATHYN